ncbi:MAG: hypothetical protein ACRD5H_06235, partial [Nitrososphaerales archaeon]
ASMPRRALERQPRMDVRRAEPASYMRQTESVSVHADVQSGEAKHANASLPPVNKDDLDIPTFLRNRR